MTAGPAPRVAAGWTAGQPEPPVLPGREEAARWAAEELAKAPYREARPSWLDNALADFARWLDSLAPGGVDAPGSGVAVVLLLAAAAVVIAVAVRVVRPRLNARRPDARVVFEAGTDLTPEAHRGRAAAAAAAGDWSTAVVEQFRALVRAAEDRAVLDPQPGRTAAEVAARLGRAFGAHTAELDTAAARFDAIRYGGANAGPADHAELAALDAALAATAPDYRQGAPDALARPL
ncbi:DUF4129 domain-containing protein [Arthrobacter sp. Soil763]|uniref:DUF4129 domain-containing protein n=1 Tax=Arthrobacter sp. Soil763 TaxID=1736402 RepID=UPI0006F71E92|nr:DUF4129 domain-containing protein [Arthrobacter sp. Soil763]KRE80350.1 hypothetical protein ASG71_07505 [Arthrobacter sp. Soil763]